MTLLITLTFDNCEYINSYIGILALYSFLSIVIGHATPNKQISDARARAPKFLSDARASGQGHSLWPFPMPTISTAFITANFHSHRKVYFSMRLYNNWDIDGL